MTDNPYKPLLTVPQVAELLGKGSQTIRNWTDEFGSALSPSANINDGSNGRHRFYEREDIAKLMMIREWRELKYRSDEIVMALRDETNWSKYLDQIEGQTLSLQIVDADNKRLEIDLALAAKELQKQQVELQRLRDMVEASTAAREENIRLKTLVQGLQQQVGSARDELTRAATLYLELLKSKDTQLNQKDQQIQDLMKDLADKREALGRASAIEEQLQQVQQNYHQYYQIAEEELRQLRQQLAVLNAELRHRSGNTGSSASVDPATNS